MTTILTYVVRVAERGVLAKPPVAPIQERVVWQVPRLFHTIVTVGNYPVCDSVGPERWRGAG